jgi:undecaprenyl-diphosphatase
MTLFLQHLFLFAKEIITHHGLTGIFWLTAMEQFIFPIPADIFVTMGTANGLAFPKVMMVVLSAAVFGSIIGYALGKYLGHPVALWLFGKRHVDNGEKFIKQWGVWGVIVAGLTPMPFKLVTWAAGIFEMPFSKFMLGVIVGRIPRYLITAYAGKLIYETKFYATTDMSALLLGTLQGVTEFLPISSSGHLVILEHFMHLPFSPEELVTFDIFLHAGSLIAIAIYFWKEWLTVLQEMWSMISGWKFIKNSLTVKLAIGTFPAVIGALAFGSEIEGPLRSLPAVAICFIATSFFYFYVVRKTHHAKTEEISLKSAVIIGLAQAVSLVPAIPRSGSTIGAAMLTGIKREEAAKFSFLLGGVAILAANVYNLFSIRNGAPVPELEFTLLGAGSAFIASLLSIHLLLKFLKKHTLAAFGIYLLIAGSLLLTFAR